MAGLRNSGQGIFGGYPGAPSLLVLWEGTRLAELMAGGNPLEDLRDLRGHRRLLPYCEFRARGDDVIYTRVGSGGGYGDPLEREPERVLEDVRNGLVSREAARDLYGVVIDEEIRAVDRAASEQLRRIALQSRLTLHE